VGIRAPPPEPEQRDEETLDRELGELTGELRTVIPGGTVLVAFLLTVPFGAAFPELDRTLRGAYFVAFLSSALAVVFLVGESASHRVRGKPYDKGKLVKTANRQAVTALVLLAVALTAVVFFVTDVLFSSAVSITVTAAVLVLMAATWFGLPLLRRARDQ
jgi:uncharacterized protein DUF6328